MLGLSKQTGFEVGDPSPNAHAADIHEICRLAPADSAALGRTTGLTIAAVPCN